MRDWTSCGSQCLILADTAFPESLMAKEYEVLADNLLKACGYKVSEGNLEKLNNKKVKSDNKDESNDTKKEEAKC